MSNRHTEAICIEQELSVGAAPEQVFRALTEDVGAWWTHRFKGDGSTVSLEPEIGGRFRETFPHGGGALFAVVTYLDPGRRLTMRGPMGMAGAVAGVISFDLEPVGPATRLRLSHRVLGDVSDEERDEYAAGWKSLLNAGLKAFVERQQATV